jgi:hypothetical protein
MENESTTENLNHFNMWIAKPIYESLPYFYLLAGIIACRDHLAGPVDVPELLVHAHHLFRRRSWVPGRRTRRVTKAA